MQERQPGFSAGAEIPAEAEMDTGKNAVPDISSQVLPTQPYHIRTAFGVSVRKQRYNGFRRKLNDDIHVHIVINSLRIENVPLLPYMDRPADTKAGCKHRCTDAAMEYFKAEVMELCHEVGLYQIDLLNGSANRVTEREYWARKKGQAAIDRENEKRRENHEPLIHTKFETDKEKLRRIIRKALNESFTVEDFARKLLQYGVTVKESRGRFSYLTPDRTKPITARKLGDSFDKAAVLAALEQNALRPANTVVSAYGIPLDRPLSSNEGASDRSAPKQSAPKQLPKRKEVAQEIQSLISEKNEC